MTSDSAEQAIVTSAVIVSGVYFYRKLTDPALGKAVAGPVGGSGARAAGALFGRPGTGPAPVGKWLIGFGVAFMVIAVMASINAQLGAAFAILVATGSVLTNGAAIAADVQKKTA